VTWLGVETFRNSGLISIVIPDSVEHIGEEAEVAAEVGTKNYLFADCARLTSVVLSSNLVTMSAYCFYNCAALESITYNGFEGEGNSLPKTLTVVGSYAFTNTQSLLQLDMPAVKDVGQYVFGDTDKKEGETSLASGIVTVSMPSLETVGVGLFRNCTALESVTLNNNLKALGSYMFANCTALKNITLPEELTYMNTYTFQNSGLTSIVIPSKVEHMGKTADTAATTSEVVNLFDGCESLTSVTLPAGLLTMGSYVFRNCTSLVKVTYSGYEGEYNALPETLSILGSSSFANCAFDNISIPEALKSTNSSVFSGCNLVRVAYNAIAMTTTGVLKDMTNLTQVVFGDKVESLPGHSFYGCVNLQNVTLPDSIETIAYGAFRDCNAMTEIVLGKNVILDGGCVFWGWTEEQTIYVKQSAYMSFRLWSTSWMEECNATIVWDYVGTQESDS
jgi:putative surface protein bspA-like